MACHSSSSRLRVLDTALVTPSGPSLPPSSLPLTFLDLQWIHSPPVERIFFYHIGAPHADLVVSSLKASLSTALRAFFPLAGRLRATTATGRPDILYEPGDGVTFTLAEYDADLSDLASDHHSRQVAELAQLVPRLGHADADGGAALLSVQATVLLPRGDLALGVTVHHAACDGAGSASFLHTWAAACVGVDKPLPPAPVIDRTLIAEPPGLYNHYMSNLPSTDEIEFVKMSPDQLLATFTLSSEQLQGVKDAVAGEAARRGQTPPRRSTLVAALGFIWSCYRRAKAETGDGAADPQSPTYFIVPVDHRQLMKPPVPATYLGNCIGPAIGAAAKEELASAGVEGLFTACAAIAAGIEKAVASPGWETMAERVKEAGARGVLSVAGSPRLRVYDVDFGFGPPAKVEIVSVARTGAMAVAERRGGGMEVGMSLPPAGMAAFRSCFADGVACLSSSHSTHDR
ncbi:phenolic glucoside malonyltransferase 2-like [Hordeum vulgare]|nr:phenolic glucoside malonyltransferase 2-like [Hordeum vulgare]